MKEWFKKVLASMIEARQRQANVNDIGIGRGDIKRVVYENEVETKEQSTNSKKSKKSNVSWRQYIYSKLGWELHKANHA